MVSNAEVLAGASDEGVVEMTRIGLRWRIGARAVLCAAAIAAVIAVACPALASAASWTVGSGSAIAQTEAGAGASYNYIGCSSAGNCTAAGTASFDYDASIAEYLDTYPIVAQEVNGVWKPG